MKRGVVIVFIFLFLIFSIFLVSAGEYDKRDKAYSWLVDKTNSSKNIKTDQ